MAIAREAEGRDDTPVAFDRPVTPRLRLREEINQRAAGPETTAHLTHSGTSDRSWRLESNDDPAVSWRVDLVGDEDEACADGDEREINAKVGRAMDGVKSRAPPRSYTPHALTHDFNDSRPVIVVLGADGRLHCSDFMVQFAGHSGFSRGVRKIKNALRDRALEGWSRY